MRGKEVSHYHYAGFSLPLLFATGSVACLGNCSSMSCFCLGVFFRPASLQASSLIGQSIIAYPYGFLVFKRI